MLKIFWKCIIIVEGLGVELYKFNRMKTTKVIFLLIGILPFIAGCGSAQKVSYNIPSAKQLVGLWEVKAIHNSDEAGYMVIPSGKFKMIFDDGRFMNFMSTEKGAIITVDGTYKLDGDLYTEKIEHSFNKRQEGKDNPLNIKMTRTSFMYLRWFQPVDEFSVTRNRWIEEIWQRVTIEDFEVSNVDLRQELRLILDNDELIKQMTP